MLSLSSKWVYSSRDMIISGFYSDTAAPKLAGHWIFRKYNKRLRTSLICFIIYCRKHGIELRSFQCLFLWELISMSFRLVVSFCKKWQRVNLVKSVFSKGECEMFHGSVRFYGVWANYNLLNCIHAEVLNTSVRKCRCETAKNRYKRLCWLYSQYKVNSEFIDNSVKGLYAIDFCFNIARVKLTLETVETIRRNGSL